ncbi:hypothetical protein DK867_12340 [Ochrobactrum sp. POC9]|nr:hypothetical protein DK867_12340 [Ochrobactrum sp. POC9]
MKVICHICDGTDIARTTQCLIQKPPCQSANGNLSAFRCSRSFLRRIVLSEKSATFRDYAWKYAVLRYSKITIFAAACRFLIQTLSVFAFPHPPSCRKQADMKQAQP